VHVVTLANHNYN